MPNGITTSFLNLISNIDYERYEVFVMVDTWRVEKDKQKCALIHSIDSRCQLILRRPKFVLSKDEEQVYESFSLGNALSLEEKRLLSAGFARETKRIIGLHEFDIAIDFSGYSQFWSLFVAHVEAKHHIVYQHNDLFAEVTTKSQPPA